MNKNIITLDKIKVGDKANIVDINKDSKLKRRLQDLGIIKNSKLECVLKSPFNDPSAYLVRGTVIALREDDSKDIWVEICNE